ncbi:GTPase family protein [Salinibius halmophilus]|uniref:GTPase family protein n=1 Tax=Salinibius halmophilus TaxID=1853216 RepID=UPI000E670FE2|nr:GTPase [Salinibius halmophilus]
MSKTNNQLAQALKGKLFWFVLLFIVGTLPTAAVLIVFGVLYAIEQQWLLVILAVSLISVALVWLASRLWLRRLSAQMPALETQAPLGHWSAYDEEVWQKQLPLIKQLVADNPDWRELPAASLEMIQNIAQSYQKSNELAFSLPEALRLTEEVSRRYREVLIAQVPYIEQAKLSYIKTGFDNKKSLKTGFKAYKFTYNLYRAYRTINPLAALVGEARNIIVNQVGKKLLAETDQLLKTALLEEIGRTAIDLYSGRFQATQQQTAEFTPPVNAITISVIGQVSAGKSSLVNALCQQMNAEVHRLPSTNEAAAYECEISQTMRLHLVDLPGLDGTTKREKTLLQAVQNSDLVIWVLKANQPARQLDRRFKAQIDAYYQDHPDKLAPIQLGVLNQVDLLANLANATDSIEQSMLNSEIVQQALAYNEELLAMQVIPVCLAPNPVNLNSLLASIELLYEQAVNTQLNRQRRAKVPGLSAQAQRAATLSKTLFRRWQR